MTPDSDLIPDGADELEFKQLTAEEVKILKQSSRPLSPWRVVGMQVVVGISLALMCVACNRFPRGGLVGCLWRACGGAAGGGICSWSGAPAASAQCGVRFRWIFCVGGGQNCLDDRNVVCGAEVDFGFELVGFAGWFRGDDEGVLGGHVVALGAQRVGRKDSLNRFIGDIWLLLKMLEHMALRLGNTSSTTCNICRKILPSKMSSKPVWLTSVCLTSTRCFIR